MASVTMESWSDDQDFLDSEEEQGALSSEGTMSDVEGEPTGSKASDSLLGYQVLSIQEAESLQAQGLQQVCELLHCSNTVARSILIHFRWDPERVMGVYVDKGVEKLYQMVGLPAPSDSTPKAAAAAQGSMTCQICCETVDAKKCPTMLCGHSFCASCWAQHFKVGVDEGKARNLRCMAYKCGAPCDEAVVQQLLRGTPEGRKFDEALATSYVEDNSMACFCPSAPWCGNVIVVSSDPVVEPDCKCGNTFCFKCRRAPHSPCTCEMWDKWEEKTQGDSETRNWIMANTKPCPRCNKPVEKNGGCNHVTCKCGQSFCWLCGASTGMAHTYSNIEGHTCGRWKDELDKKITDAATSHKRYMHYFERFKGHTDSYKKECEKRSSLLERMQEQLAGSCEARHYDWLVAAMDQLKVARRALAPSYVFAYFTFGNDMFKDDFTPEQNSRNQNLFEDQQQMLESEVERLSNLTALCSAALSNSTAVLDDAERVKVINSTVNIERRIAKFYEQVQEILDQLQTCSARIASFMPRKLTAMGTSS